MSEPAGPYKCALYNDKIKAVLDRLHKEARKDGLRMLNLTGPAIVDLVKGKRPGPFRGAEDKAHALRRLYIAVSREMGDFLYATARAMNATRIVEFGASFGVSTIYLAAAVQDNGGGVVISTEIERDKVKEANANLKEAGLADLVDIREGDALKTLLNITEPVDLVLLDGWKDLYLPLLVLLNPIFRPGTVIVADDITRFKSALISYLDFMSHPSNGFISVRLPLGDGCLYSVKV